MKSHLLTLTAAVLAIFAFSSCKKDPGYGDPAVKVNPGELNFKVDGGSETVNLTATVEWTVENSASWVKVEPMAGDPSKELQPPLSHSSRPTVPSPRNSPSIRKHISLRYRPSTFRR